MYKRQGVYAYDPAKQQWIYGGGTGRPLGSMYKNEITPDGYQTDADGAWTVSYTHLDVYKRQVCLTAGLWSSQMAVVAYASTELPDENLGNGASEMCIRDRSWSRRRRKRQWRNRWRSSWRGGSWRPGRQRGKREGIYNHLYGKSGGGS